MPGLTMAEVRSMSEVEKLLRFGAANRTVSSTRMNQHSSRSHQVLTVYLTSKDKRTGVATFPVQPRTGHWGSLADHWAGAAHCSTVWLADLHRFTPSSHTRALSAMARAGTQVLFFQAQRSTPVLSPGWLLRQPLRVLPCRRGGARETAPD